MLSRQRSLEQERAARAWDCVQAAKREPYAAAYGALTRGAPTDVQSSGLGQTLAFWSAKGSDGGKLGHNEESALLADVSRWLKLRLGLAEQTNIVEWIAKTAKADDYRRAAAEAIAFLVWVKRFAEAELPKPQMARGSRS